MKTLMIVATTAGAGATTMAAFAFAANRDDRRGAPALYGREGGGLVERAGGDDVPFINSSVAIWDAGVMTPQDCAQVMETRDTALAVIAPGTPLGSVDLSNFLAALTDANPAHLYQVITVRTGVYGRASLQQLAPQPGEIVIPFDGRLARPGSIPHDDAELDKKTRAGVDAWQSSARWALGV